ncbi:uncharacterized protein LOC115884262 [Sitophilus oryzae]|uniref:Uncharacterized protein LOC115884262 n=1 Tax=Sitophilus oryzae TaxID=7048 RepID=A0A6J2Y6N5_SITOR|nr:uncharacterized protein LOC115884262 [Sitophilus oryzae]
MCKSCNQIYRAVRTVFRKLRQHILQIKKITASRSNTDSQQYTKILADRFANHIVDANMEKQIGHSHIKDSIQESSSKNRKELHVLFGKARFCTSTDGCIQFQGSLAEDIIFA